MNKAFYEMYNQMTKLITKEYDVEVDFITKLDCLDAGDELLDELYDNMKDMIDYKKRCIYDFVDIDRNDIKFINSIISNLYDFNKRLYWDSVTYIKSQKLRKEYESL